jgi:hypothetical protein
MTHRHAESDQAQAVITLVDSFAGSFIMIGINDQMLKIWGRRQIDLNRSNRTAPCMEVSDGAVGRI